MKQAQDDSIVLAEPMISKVWKHIFEVEWFASTINLISLNSKD